MPLKDITYLIFSPKQQDLATIDYLYKESGYNDDILSAFKEIPENNIRAHRKQTFLALENIILNIFPDAKNIEKSNTKYYMEYILDKRLYKMRIFIIYNSLYLHIEYKKFNSDKDREQIINDVEYIRNIIAQNYKLITIADMEDDYRGEILFDGNKVKRYNEHSYIEDLQRKLDNIQTKTTKSLKYAFIAYPAFITHCILLCYTSFILYSFANQTSNVLKDLDIDKRYQLVIEEKSIGKYYLDIPPFKLAIFDDYFVSGRIDNLDFSTQSVSEHIYNNKGIGSSINVLKTNYSKEPYVTEHYYNGLLPYIEHNGTYYSSELLLSIACLLFLIYYLISIIKRKSYIEISQFIVSEAKSYAHITIIPAIMLALYCLYVN